MKHIFLAVIFFFLTACGAESSNNNAVQEQQAEEKAAIEREKRILDEKMAIEAQRIISIQELIKSSARHPSFSSDLETLLSDYTNELENYKDNKDCRLVSARVFAYGKVIEGSARQPELSEVLNQQFDQWAGPLAPEDIKPCESARYMRSFTIGKLIEAIFRQPELITTFTNETEARIGNYEQVEPDDGETSLVLAGAIQSQGKAIEAMARQPDLEKEDGLISQINQQFLPPKSDYKNADSCLANKARLFAINYYLEAAARQPELFHCANGTCSEYYIPNMPQSFIGSLTPASDIGECSLPIITTLD